MSSYKERNLFGSGPHQFILGAHANSVVPNVFIGRPPPGSTPQGIRELDITVRGRLVASSESALDALRFAITELITQPPLVSELVDEHGRTWPDMSLIEYRELGPTDRARTRSVSYQMVFRRFI